MTEPKLTRDGRVIGVTLPFKGFKPLSLSESIWIKKTVAPLPCGFFNTLMKVSPNTGQAMLEPTAAMFDSDYIWLTLPWLYYQTKEYERLDPTD